MAGWSVKQTQCPVCSDADGPAVMREKPVGVYLGARPVGWKAELGLEDMCADSWRWISNNPNGYSA